MANSSLKRRSMKVNSNKPNPDMNRQMALREQQRWQDRLRQQQRKSR